MMKIFSQVLALLLIVVVLSSCATTHETHAVVSATELPADVAMNREAGRGMLLFVKLRLESGEEIPCALDTGAPTSHLPREVESKLGKRLGTRKFSNLDEDNITEYIYASPKLFLGGTRLVTGDQIGIAGTTMGVIGMDCLRHYCIQLDFQAGKLRFLDPEGLNPEELGKAFLLVPSPYAMIMHGGFFNDNELKLIIDTGCAFDAYLDPRSFRVQFKEQQAKTIPMLKDGVNHEVSPGLAQFSHCNWEGGNYTNLIVGTGPNLIGLRFLARHKVTLNFPKGIMYLKQQSVGPLVSDY